jgi:hypothetical protein
MKYIIDTSSLSTVFKHFYREAFPSFWERFDRMVGNEEIVSTREVRNEIKNHVLKDEIEAWVKNYSKFFPTPTVNELQFITQIYSVTHFRNSISQKELWKGKPLADPFVIAKAYVENGTVITEEVYKPHAAKIPNICEYFKIPCINLQEFLKQHKWVF